MTKIALIEDNPDNRLLVEAMLEEFYQVVQFEDGPSALKGLPGADTELILLDISLPGMDGLEVLKHLKEMPETAHQPVIALTAHAMSGDRERFLGAGFDAYLSKPILDTDHLTDLIDRLLSQAKTPTPTDDDAEP